MWHLQVETPHLDVIFVSKKRFIFGFYTINPPQPENFSTFFLLFSTCKCDKDKQVSIIMKKKQDLVINNVMVSDFVWGRITVLSSEIRMAAPCLWMPDVDCFGFREHVTQLFQLQKKEWHLVDTMSVTCWASSAIMATGPHSSELQSISGLLEIYNTQPLGSGTLLFGGILL